MDKDAHTSSFLPLITDPNWVGIIIYLFYYFYLFYYYLLLWVCIRVCLISMFCWVMSTCFGLVHTLQSLLICLVFIHFAIKDEKKMKGGAVKKSLVMKGSKKSCGVTPVNCKWTMHPSGQAVERQCDIVRPRWNYRPHRLSDIEQDSLLQIQLPLCTDSDLWPPCGSRQAK